MKSLFITQFPDAELQHKWNVFLAGTDLATQYVSPYFFDDPFVRGERFAILALDDIGSVRGVLTGVTGPGTITSGLPTRPQLALRSSDQDPSIAMALLNGVAALRRGTGLIDVHSWTSLPAFQSSGFQDREDLPGNEVVMLDLNIGEGTLFAGFSQTRRNEIRKALKQNELEIKQLETSEELQQLHEIHVRWSEAKGNRAESISTFQRAMEQKESRVTFIAKHNKRVIAGSFFRFYPGGVVEYAANNSLPEYQKLRPNDLICWHAIQWACRNGFRHFSMGGAHLFLRRFGGTIVRTHRYRKDLTLFRQHDKRERMLEAAAAGKRMLLPPVRAFLKPVFGTAK
jgi:hypothetical protein